VLEKALSQEVQESHLEAEDDHHPTSAQFAY